jgi:hypothetical protein
MGQLFETIGNSSPRKSTSSDNTLPSDWKSVVLWSGRSSRGLRTAS